MKPPPPSTKVHCANCGAEIILAKRARDGRVVHLDRYAITWTLKDSIVDPVANEPEAETYVEHAAVCGVPS